MGQVNWVLTADETEFLQACLKAHNKLEGLGTAGQQAGQKTQSAFAGATKELGNFAVAMTGIGSVTAGIMAIVSQLKAEYEHLVTQQKNAATAQLTVAEASASALLKKPDNMDAKWLESLISKTAGDQKVEEARVWGMAGSMLPAKGRLSNEQFASALGLAAHVESVTGGQSDGTEYGKASLKIMSATGQKDPTAAIGWMRRVSQKAGISDMDEAVKMIGPLMEAGDMYGASMQESAKLAAYASKFSQGTLRRPGDAILGMIESIAKARTKEGAFIPQGGPGAMFGEKFKPLKGQTIEDNIKELQDWYTTANAHDREVLAGKLPGGNPKMKAAMLGLISRDPKAMSVMQGVSDIGNVNAPGNATAWTSYFKDVEGGKYADIQDVHRNFADAKNQADLANRNSMGGEVRENLKEYLGKAPGVSDLDIKAAMAKYELTSEFGTKNPTKVALDIVKSLQEQQGYGMPYVNVRAAGAMVEDGLRRYMPALPAGATEGEHWTSLFSDTGKKYWTNPNAGQNDTGYIGQNPNYNPAQGQAINDLVKILTKIATKMEADEGKDKNSVQDVRVIGGPVNVGAHRDN